MATVYEIEPEVLIKEVAKDLKEKDNFKMPEWASFVKTGSHNQKAPQDDNWWWIRSAAVLRKIYVNGPVGVQRLRTSYGGKKNRGVKPEKFRRAGGKVIRTILQEFDKMGLTQQNKTGRSVTAKGQSYLDKAASRIKKE